MAEDFPALIEKQARLEQRLGEVTAAKAELEKALKHHTGHWELTLAQDGHERGRWQIPTDGDFSWDGHGWDITLKKIKD